MMTEGMRRLLQLYRSAAPDYTPDGPADGLDTPDGPALVLKEILADLPEEDRALMVAYSELGSAKKLGDLLGLTKQTAWRAVKETRQKILDEYAKRTANSR